MGKKRRRAGGEDFGISCILRLEFSRSLPLDVHAIRICDCMSRSLESSHSRTHARPACEGQGRAARSFSLASHVCADSRV